MADSTLPRVSRPLVVALALGAIATRPVHIATATTRWCFVLVFLVFSLLDVAVPIHAQTVVFGDDTVLPQFVDGGGWKTSVVFNNLDAQIRRFTFVFFDDHGRDLFVPIVGMGRVHSVDVTLSPGQSLTIETAGTDVTLAQGWGQLKKASPSDGIGAIAVFRQSVQGRPDQEAVVPVVSDQARRSVLLFDNSGFVTGIAIANPNLDNVAVPVVIRDEAGNTLQRDQIVLGPRAHDAFTMPNRWPVSANIRGSLEFTPTRLGIGVLGLRFAGAAFTSFHALTDIKSLRPPDVFPMVPATANIALAGAVDGRRLFQGDSSPLNSPIAVPTAIVVGQVLQFSASGSVVADRFVGEGGPDGIVASRGTSDSALGISSITGPLGALIGVFIGPDVPDTNRVPPDVNFTGATRDLVTLRPLLQQPFYVGRGTTASGAVRNVVVPQGASRLLLGVLGNGPNAADTGNFNVAVFVVP